MLTATAPGAAFVGDVVPISFEAAVGTVDTDDPVALTVLHPDGTTETLTPTHDGTGLYLQNYDTTGKPAGHYGWVAHTSGATKAVAVGGFDLIDPLATGDQLVDVVPWCGPTDLRRRPGCADIPADVLDDAARAASYIVWALSGRQFQGRRVATVRPNARARGFGRAGWGALGGFGWFGSWGVCGSAIGFGYGAAAVSAWSGHGCSVYPAEVELGNYPVTEILAVKIDGDTIPTNEYRIYEHRLFVRTLPSETATPTTRSGWPTCQRLDLPDTEPGTFSVEFAYGASPPRAGVMAAASLAAEFALLWDSGDSETRLPARVRSVVRQGESITLIDPQDVLDKGRTGIPDVDLFLKSVNPSGLQRRARVWSPDMGRARRPS